mmetsp:Transcript_8348/g.8505  ORF Transcript_8348/g.8505 Transcript_8348/m.8505 type:complete len:264 (-) Transcript_8348:637-1428(-)|eukprot:CAMPEP_0182424040 /NCGR_PEP_ID=MMETSP1167-20130531/10178_1 /TAXON_ID=2988 /ORGANISM="Mallomonas Sp, Strain CCMP3275" /LENGTH=263 /DNA_ID=CAMNT_0024603533 /DNA_START=271 /DNA_END=1062 /DNA_ORIENTATION=-
MDESNGHHHGNFKSYYTFHSTEERMSRLSKGLFKSIWEVAGRPPKFLMLDIGCNEGDLSIELLKTAQSELGCCQCFMLGIDLDEGLIKRAEEKLEGNESCRFTALDIMTIINNNDQTVDLVNQYLHSHDSNFFSFVSCFSITMWIHMNHHDSGLESFLLKAIRLTKCTGTLLLEPQPWPCYRKAMQRCRRKGITELPYYQDLRVRNIEKFLSDYVTANGLLEVHALQAKDWGRQLMIFSHVSLSIYSSPISSEDGKSVGDLSY